MIEIKYARAPFIRRFIAYIPDMLVFDVLILSLYYYIMGSNLEYFPFTVNVTFLHIPLIYYPAQLALEYLIQVFIWSYVWIQFKGKSIGMYFVQTRILAYPSLENMGIKQAIIRYFAMDFCLIGFVLLIFDIAIRLYQKHLEVIPLLMEVGALILLILPLCLKHKRAWHDIIAGTCVIDEKRVKEQEAYKAN